MRSRRLARKWGLVIVAAFLLEALWFPRSWTSVASAGTGPYKTNWSTWGTNPFMDGSTECAFPGHWTLGCVKVWQTEVTFLNTGEIELWDVRSETANDGSTQGACGAGFVEAPGGTSYGTYNGQSLSPQPWGGGCTPAPPPPNQPPSVTLNCPSSGYTGDTVTVTASASDPNPGDTISWSWGGSGTSNSLSVTLDGSWKQVTVAVRDSQNAWDEASCNIQVLSRNKPPTVSLSCPAEVTLNNGKATATCSATGSDPDPGQSVSMSLEGATGTGSVSKQLEYTAPGSYTVTASGTDTGSPPLSASAQKTISVKGTGPSVSVSCSPGSLTADGSTTSTCSASVSGGTSPYTYSWGSSTKTFGPWSAQTTVPVSVTVTDKNNLTGAGSTSIIVGPPNAPPPPPPTTCSGGKVPDGNGGCTCPPGEVEEGGQCVVPCYPDPDDRSLTLSLSETMVRAPGGVVTAFLSTSGTTSNRRATASWGETKDFEHSNGRWQVQFMPPPMTGEWTIRAEATIRQSDGCGDTYGPDTFSDSEKFSSFKAATPRPTDPPPDDEAMAVANLPLADYLQVCLDTLEPSYCGIDARLAEQYTREVIAREGWYAVYLGPFKWNKFVRRIDRAFAAAGLPESGLALVDE